MDMNAMKGTQSIAFSESPYLVSAGSVAGKKEGEGPLGKYFDIASEDDLFGEKTWELAEGTMQKLACKLALKNAGVQPEEVRYLFGGDILRQGIATSMGAGDLVLAATSSHFGSAEKEFRFPLGYANQRPLSSTWTVTGSGAFLVGKKKSRVRISGVTIGKIVDYGLKDSQNMGACMAPAACDTILQNLMDFGRGEKDYDRIITGDRGYVGQSILFDLLRKKGLDIKENHMDCGMTIFDQQTQHTNSGGSGCGCAAITLAAYIMPQLISGEWKRILFVPTGALMSTVSFNEGESVPGIAHGIVLEHC